MHFARCLLLTAALGCASGAGGPPVQYEGGERAAVTDDGLHRLKSRRMAAVYLRPGASFVGYRRLLVSPVQIFFAEDGRDGGSEAKGALSPVDERRFRRIFQEVLEEELGASPSFEIVEAPGPDVLRIRSHVVDLVLRARTEKSGARVYSLGAGELTVLLDVSDSESGVALGRLVDRKRIGSSTTLTHEDFHPHAASLGIGTAVSRSADAQWTNLRRIFRGWARVLRQGLEELIVLGPVPGRETGFGAGGTP